MTRPLLYLCAFLLLLAGCGIGYGRWEANRTKLAQATARKDREDKEAALRNVETLKGELRDAQATLDLIRHVAMEDRKRVLAATAVAQSAQRDADARAQALLLSTPPEPSPEAILWAAGEALDLAKRLEVAP